MFQELVLGCLDTFGTLSEHCLIHSLDPCITGVEADAGSRNSACVELNIVRLSDSPTRTCWRSGMYQFYIGACTEARQYNQCVEGANGRRV